MSTRAIFLKWLVAGMLSIVFVAPLVEAQTQEKSVTQPALRSEASSVQKGDQIDFQVSAERVRKDRRTALKMANYHWLDKAAEGNPDLIASITAYEKPARVLAAHPRIAEIAAVDHYVCRRLTKWKSASRALASNGYAYKVIALDPEGIYRAIKRDRKTARLLAKNPQFDQMIDEDPQLGKLMAQYM